MLVPSIIDRYVFREIAVSSLFCFAVFLVTGLIAGFLPLLQRGLAAGLDLTLILFQVLINALPGTLVTVLPLSMMIGILLGLGRMAADNEIAAIKSSGISILRLFPPVLLMGLLGFALSLLCTLVLIPKGVAEGERLVREGLTKRVDAGMEERTFFDTLKNLVVYVEKIDSGTGVLNRVFIRESSNPNEIRTIIAEKGKSIPDPEGKSFILNLKNGTVLTENRHGETTGGLPFFESYVFRYPLSQAGLTNSQPTLEELSVSGIRRRVEEITVPKESDTAEIRNYYKRVRRIASILITQRFTYPLACLALAIAAFPLGVLNMGNSRLNNVSLGLAAMFVYYASTLAVERAARSGLAPTELVLPLPAVIFVLGAGYLLRCVQMERVPAILRYSAEFVMRLRRQGP